MDSSTPKHQTRFKFNLKLLLQIILPLLLLTIIPLQLAKNISYNNKRSQKPINTTPLNLNYDNNININININDDDGVNVNVNPESSSSSLLNNNNNNNKGPPKHGSLPPTTRKCDIFSGEWVPNPEGPYYTNKSCWAIHEHQNCMKYGRPDSEFMKWRWKPDECELPLFNPRQFFEIMRGKSLAFVGDSVARNQMQSLICLLSRVEYPYDVSYTKDEHFKRWHYNNYNFTVAIFTTPFLVKAQENDPNGPTGTGIFGLFLDEVDESWSTQIDEFDYIILSAGHWFFRSLMYYENQKLIGCRFCQMPNVTDYTIAFGYQKVFRTVFQAILERENFKGVVYLRTFAPSHFEGGDWNNGGNCLRQKPFKSSQINLQGVDLDMYMAQLGEFKKAQKLGRERGMRFRLMDLTQSIMMRPDGHPSRFGHWPNENVTLYNDCVHWCLPGPIDTWNDFLLEMIRSEGVMSKEDMVALHSSERKLKSRRQS